MKTITTQEIGKSKKLVVDDTGHKDPPKKQNKKDREQKYKINQNNGDNSRLWHEQRAKRPSTFSVHAGSPASDAASEGCLRDAKSGSSSKSHQRADAVATCRPDAAAKLIFTLVV
jgi:hypothetical protein